MQYIENKTFDEIEVGDTAQLVRTLKTEDIELFAVMSGDVNPAHVDEEFAKSDMFHEVIAHGMWGGALISAVLGTELPGPGTIYLKQSLSFRKPVGIGDTVTVLLTVKEKITGKNRLVLSCLCKNQHDQTVIEGLAEVVAPREKIRRPRVVLPEVLMHERGARYHDLFVATKDLKPIRTAVVHPCDTLSLESALEARNRGLIEPILLGPWAKIKQTAAEAGRSLKGITIIDAAHSQAAARCALQLVREEKADAIMKGALQTDKLMAEVVKRDSGLRTERLMSHVYVLDVPHYSKLLMITDAEINIAPDLQGKREIVQNSIDLAHAMGIAQPKVALLSALEDIAPKIPSTIDAAALCKMAERGQITGALVDGPLSFDIAISKAAAESKHIQSDIAGDVDILVAPDLEAGAMIAQQLAGAEASGIVLGASVPIMLSSRADSTLARLASCALAQMLFNRKD
jgi:phosphate acetyltransferase